MWKNELNYLGCLGIGGAECLARGCGMDTCAYNFKAGIRKQEVVMKRGYLIAVGLVGCVVVAVIAYFWATGLMDSLYAYRSPLQNHPPEPGPALGETVSKRVVFVLIDGLRLDTSMKAEVMPYLNELRQTGAWGTMHSRPPSYSAPGYSVLFTGAWPQINDGPVMNLEYEEIPTWTQDNLVSAIHRAGLKTGISGYDWFEKLIPQEAVTAGFYTPEYDRQADREVVDAALPWIEEGEYEFVFVHLDQVDYAGHYEGGPLDPRWDESANRSDALLREVAASLDFERDTLFVCSDHGHIDRGGHGGNEQVVLLEPYVMVGAGVKAGQHGDIRMVDVAPTLAALLGANIPAASQGRVLVEMVDFSASQLESIQAALEIQQSRLLESFQAGIGLVVTVPEGSNVVETHQAALESGYRRVANAQTTSRMLSVLILAFFPASWLYRKRGRTVGLLLGAAVVYVVLFNLRYAVIDGFTYSLSSVIGANELIIYTAVTAAAALLIAWVAGMIVLKAYRQGPAGATLMSLALVWVILFVLSIPVLVSFWKNGVMVDLTLPDFGSLFLGFQSLLQILVVGLLGLPLTGLAALVGAWQSKKQTG
jgi:hypothetical protein